MPVWLAILMGATCGTYLVMLAYALIGERRGCPFCKGYLRGVEAPLRWLEAGWRRVWRRP